MEEVVLLSLRVHYPLRQHIPVWDCTWNKGVPVLRCACVDVPVFIAIVCPSSIVCFDEIVIFRDRYEAVNYLEHQCETGVCSSLR